MVRFDGKFLAVILAATFVASLTMFAPQRAFAGEGERYTLKSGSNANPASFNSMTFTDGFSGQFTIEIGALDGYDVLDITEVRILDSPRIAGHFETIGQPRYVASGTGGTPSLYVDCGGVGFAPSDNYYLTLMIDYTDAVLVEYQNAKVMSGGAVHDISNKGVTITHSPAHNSTNNPKTGAMRFTFGGNLSAISEVVLFDAFDGGFYRAPSTAFNAATGVVEYAYDSSFVSNIANMVCGYIGFIGTDDEFYLDSYSFGVSANASAAGEPSYSITGVTQNSWAGGRFTVAMSYADSDVYDNIASTTFHGVSADGNFYDAGGGYDWQPDGAGKKRDFAYRRLAPNQTYVLKVTTEYRDGKAPTTQSVTFTNPGVVKNFSDPFVQNMQIEFDPEGGYEYAPTEGGITVFLTGNLGLIQDIVCFKREKFNGADAFFSLPIKGTSTRENTKKGMFDYKLTADDFSASHEYGQFYGNVGFIGTDGNFYLMNGYTFYSEDSAVPGGSIAHEFTDPAFLAKVREIIGKPTGAILAEDVAGITALDVTNLGVSSLTGIRYFTSLTHLYCNLNRALTTLDLSANTALEYVTCRNNSLTSLKLPRTASLTEVACDGNNLTTLDVSGCTALETLDCYQNYFASEAAIIGLNRNVTTNFNFPTQKAGVPQIMAVTAASPTGTISVADGVVSVSFNNPIMGVAGIGEIKIDSNRVYIPGGTLSQMGVSLSADGKTITTPRIGWGTGQHIVRVSGFVGQGGIDGLLMQAEYVFTFYVNAYTGGVNSGNEDSGYVPVPVTSSGQQNVGSAPAAAATAGVQQTQSAPATVNADEYPPMASFNPIEDFHDSQDVQTNKTAAVNAQASSQTPAPKPGYVPDPANGVTIERGGKTFIVVDDGDGIIFVFDAEGTPLGYLVVTNGIIPEGDDFFNELIPLGSIGINAFNNPKTATVGASAAPLALCICISAAFGLAGLSLRRRKR